MNPPDNERLVVQSGRKILFIDIVTISYIEACNYYALIHAAGKTYVVRETLNDFERRLDIRSFLRIHRSIILNLNIFQRIERRNNSLMVHTTIGRDFRISRYRQKEIKERILA